MRADHEKPHENPRRSDSAAVRLGRLRRVRSAAGAGGLPSLPCGPDLCRAASLYNSARIRRPARLLQFRISFRLRTTTQTQKNENQIKANLNNTRVEAVKRY